MLFNSFTFFVFFPTVVALYFAWPERHRWALLLVASYVFYGAWKPAYLLLIFASTLVDYAVGLWLGREERPRRRRALLAASLTVNLGLLVAFKYLDFFARSLGWALESMSIEAGIPGFDLLLPVGISFYTFQTISYSVDVYRRARAPEPHFGRFALYVSFFPQLVAGPIERSTRLLPQLKRAHAFDFDRLVAGLGLMLWGLFKKSVIADRAAPFVDAVYAHPDHFTGATVIVATYAFAFQIYCDFSGYTDIAIGAARVLGIELMENFERPYWSTNIQDFWRRWHISLSTWFRDYLYVPLGGSRGTATRRALNIAVVFVLSGLWHGANWTFVLWGAFHGVLLVLTMLVASAWRPFAATLAPRGPGRAFAHVAGVVLTFHLVCLGWVLFRADDLGHAGAVLSRLSELSPASLLDDLARTSPAPRDSTEIELVILLLSIALLELGEIARRTRAGARLPVALRWSAWASLAVWTLLTAVQSHSPFIYFQF